MQPCQFALRQIKERKNCLFLTVDNFIFLTNCFFEKLTKISQYCGPHLNKAQLVLPIGYLMQKLYREI